MSHLSLLDRAPADSRRYGSHQKIASHRQSSCPCVDADLFFGVPHKTFTLLFPYPVLTAQSLAVRG
jgi:hypothetical protein